LLAYQIADLTDLISILEPHSKADLDTLKAHQAKLRAEVETIENEYNVKMKEVQIIEEEHIIEVKKEAEEDLQ